MDHSVNELGQAIGAPVENWQVPPAPERAMIPGIYCSLVPLEPAAHASQLHEAFRQDRAGADWTYLSYGPFAEAADFHAWVSENYDKPDPLFFAVVDASSGRAVGLVSFMRIAQNMGSIEIGHIHFSPQAQRTVAATEAVYLMLKWIFSAGYRRCEWKCNALNDASRAAALRLGFSFEGVFRQAAVVKGRNRDTAWFSMLDKEWDKLQAAFESWLAPGNFSPGGRQLCRLSELTAECLVTGFHNERGEVVLCVPDAQVPVGTKLL